MNKRHGSVHMVGSIAMDTCEDVFTQLSAVAGAGTRWEVKRIDTVDTGGTDLTPVALNTRSAALDAISDQVFQLLPQLAELAVLNGSADDLEALMLRLEQHISREDLLVAEVGPVVGTHTGPGVVGIAFRLK